MLRVWDRSVLSMWNSGADAAESVVCDAPYRVGLRGTMHHVQTVDGVRRAMVCLLGHYEPRACYSGNVCDSLHLQEAVNRHSDAPAKILQADPTKVHGEPEADRITEEGWSGPVNYETCSTLATRKIVRNLFGILTIIVARSFNRMLLDSGAASCFAKKNWGNVIFLARFLRMVSDRAGHAIELGANPAFARPNEIAPLRDTHTFLREFVSRVPCTPFEKMLGARFEGTQHG